MRISKPISLRTLLTASFALLALVLSGLGSLLVQQQGAERTRVAVGGEMADLARQVATLLDLGMHERWREVGVLAEVARTVAPSRDERRAWLAAMQRSYPDYAWIGVTDRSGLVTVSTGGLLEGVSVAARPWFKGGLKGLSVQDVHEAALLASKLPPLPNGEPLRFVDVAAPVLDANGEVESVIGAHLSWTWAGQVSRSIIDPVASRHPGIEVLVVAADGQVLLGPVGQQGRILPTLAEGSHLLDWPGSGEPSLAGVSRTRGSEDYPGLGWSVIVRQPAAQAFAPARQLSRTILFGGAVLALIFGGLGWLAAERIARPLGQLMRRTEALREAPAAEVSFDEVGGTREVRSLASSLDQLLTRIAVRDQALEKAKEQLERRVEERTAELRSTAGLLRATLDNMDQGLIVADAAGRVPVVSRRAVELLDLPPTMMASNPRYQEVVEAQIGAGEFSHLSADEIDALTAEGLSGYGRVHVRVRPNGTVLEIRTTPLPDGGAVRTYSDVTENRRQADELRAAKSVAEAASQAKSDFLASMSHEIRTPLNGILGYADILLDDPALGDRQRHGLERIQSAGAALLTVVNDVLDFSKIEAGQVALEPGPLVLDGLIDNATSIVGGTAAAKGLRLAVDRDPALPQHLVGDQDRIRQILLNFLNNAIKFTPSGEVRLRIRSAPVLDAPERVGLRFEVADTGIGIAEDKLPRLFQRFSQVDQSIRREYGGTGLGLAICKRLVELMGGEIGVSSERGRGSVFWFTVPLSLGTPEAQAAAATGEAPDAPPSRILLAEDLAINQEIARQLLEAAGHEVDVVGDGAEAVRAVEERRYDLVLMDIQMPRMDGLAATIRIRALPAPASDVPIVALTANVLSFQLAEFERAGMNGHVGKPFKRQELLAAVARWTAARLPVEVSTGDWSGGDSPAGVFDPEPYQDLRGIVGSDQAIAWLERLRGELDARFLSDDPSALPDEAVARSAHALVSQAGMLGFSTLSNLCRELEVACLSGSDDLAERRTAAIAAAHQARLVVGELIAREVWAAGADGRPELAARRA